ncbi:hypothetical protein SAMN05421780_109164, partial [Flexibacter flexilis DSM 6793]
FFSASLFKILTPLSFNRGAKVRNFFLTSKSFSKIFKVFSSLYSYQSLNTSSFSFFQDLKPLSLEPLFLNRVAKVSVLFLFSKYFRKYFLSFFIAPYNSLANNIIKLSRLHPETPSFEHLPLYRAANISPFSLFS